MRTEKLLEIIRQLEHLQAEVLMEPHDSYEFESLQLALNELYWLYRDWSAEELEDEIT